MKISRTALILMTAFIMYIQSGSASLAFHAGGVGTCDACHSMHNAPGSSNSSLLKASDPSSTCLHCHERPGATGPASFHVSTNNADMPPGLPPRQLTPGGDFGWLKKIYSWQPSATETVAVSDGERHGHNIVSYDYGYYPDLINVTAPGGDYPAADFSCISCHDPHGTFRRDSAGVIATSGTPIRGSGSYASSVDPQPGTSVGVYRLLAGKDYAPRSFGGFKGTYAFVSDPPAAVAPDVYNRAETLSQTRVAYGSGMSEWCQNCHAVSGIPQEASHIIVSSGTSTKPHPVGRDATLGTVVDQLRNVPVSSDYNSYVNSGNLSGMITTAYLSLVPFEEGISDYAALKAHAKTDDSYLSGPDSVSSQVMCLTCHRAHASGWDNATRWNTKTGYVVYNGTYSQEGLPFQPYGQGRRELEAQKAYYDMLATRFTTTSLLDQDTLCHKCHSGALP